MLISSFLKTGLRGMRRSIGFTTIAVFSLSIGMSVWLLLSMLLHDLQQYDQFHRNSDRIVRITSRSWNPSIDLMVPLASSPAETGPALQRALPDVEAFARIARINADAENEQGTVNLDVFAGDASFFELFDFKLLQGAAASVLARPNTMVLTEAAAHRLFNQTQVVGQVIQLGSLGGFEVTGIVENLPHQSHLQFEAMISVASIESGHLASHPIAGAMADWQINHLFWTYLVLRPNSDISFLETNINRTLQSNYPADQQSRWDFQVEALTDIALVNRDLDNQIGPVVGQRTLYVVSLFAFVILLIAVFNYVGLAISRATRRFREIGVRKVLGAHRNQLIQQFLAESMLVALASLFLSMAALVWLIPIFNDLLFMRLSGISLSFDGLASPGLLFSFVGIALAVGLIAGLVPALYLSRFRTARVLSGLFNRSTQGMRKQKTRRVLVSTQFAASIFFVLIASAMWLQIDKMLKADFGFNRNEIVAVDLQGSDLDRFRNAAQGLSSITSVSAASALPVAGDKALTYIQSDDLALPLFTYWYSVDASLLQTLGLELIAGRGFEATRESDQTEAIILNETSTRELGFSTPQAAIDQWVQVGLDVATQTPFRVVGVVRDFYFENNRNEIRRLALFNDPASWRYAVVTPNVGAATAHTDLEAAWNQAETGRPYQMHTFSRLLSDAMDPVKDARLILTIAAGLALFLSCLGLIGFSAFTAESRRHEIAVRKVVGASVSELRG